MNEQAGQMWEDKLTSVNLRVSSPVACPPPLLLPPLGFQIYAKWLQEVDTVRVTQLERGYVDAIRRLWADMGIRVCYSRRCEYQLLDSTE